jgi:hypothetical protein
MQTVAEGPGRGQLRAVAAEGEPLPLAENPATEVRTPVLVPPSAQPGLYIAPMGMGLGTRVQIETELDAMAADIRLFWSYEPDLVLRKCSAYTARLTELYVALNRVEALDRQYTRVRTQQVAIWLEELDRQFRTASRLIEVQRLDLQLLNGHP